MWILGIQERQSGIAHLFKQDLWKNMFYFTRLSLNKRDSRDIDNNICSAYFFL